MAANVETMFSVRKKPWHGLGQIVMEAPTSTDALRLAGLDWNVIQESVYTAFNEKVEGYKVNIRDTDRKVLGIVSDRYKVVQNADAFSFTDELLGKGVRYETAGSLQEGKKVWLLARLPREYIIDGEHISPYLVFSNTHDGSGSVKVAITPVRVVCNNTLNLALDTASRSFSMIHTGNIQDKIQKARDTLFMAEKYMECLGAEIEQLRKQKMTDIQIHEFIELLLPIEKDSSHVQSKNIIATAIQNIPWSPNFVISGINTSKKRQENVSCINSRHCRRILYQLSHKGSPRLLEWVAYPFSSRSS